MVILSSQPPLLIPEPLFIELLDSTVDMEKIPFRVKGVSEEKLAIINASILNIFSLNINEHLFIQDDNNPQIEFCFDSGIREYFADIEVISELPFNRNEAYVISIENQKAVRDSQIYINVGNDDAVQHALFSIAQLVNQYGSQFPALVIRDVPVFPNRGFLLDISRDRVPTMKSLESLIETLAFLKYNHFQLYTEHTFAYEGHESVWENASPMTSDEIRTIDAHCQSLNITLAANQACFTHMARWLKHDPYSKLAENNSDWEWEGNKFSGSFSLSPGNQESIELIEDLLSQLLPNFSSNMVNINCDEAIDLGTGASKELVSESGAFAVYWDFVNEIIAIVRDNKFRPMIWADVWLNTPEAQRKPFYEDTIALIWGYEPDTKFADGCRDLDAYRREVWVCPGTSCWRSVTGRTDERRANAFEAADQGLRNGAAGFLLTEWGDEGHRQQHPNTLLAMAESAQSAWSAGHSASDGKAISLQLFGDRQLLETAKWLARLGNIDLSIRKTAIKKKDNGQIVPLINATCLFFEMESKFEAECLNGTLEEWGRVDANLHKLAVGFIPLRNDRLNLEILHTLKVSKFGVQKAILRRESHSHQKRGIPELIEIMKEIIDEHRQLWLDRSRIGGLEDSNAYYEKILVDLEELD